MMELSWRTRLLLILFGISSFFMAGNAAHWVRVLWNQDQEPDANFPVRVATNEFGTGPYFRWHVLTIDGQPFTRGDQVREAVEAHRPGDEIAVTMRNPSGETKSVLIPVMHAFREQRRARDVFVVASVSLFLPVFCFFLAFLVTGIRSHDPRAWLLLALLLSFGETPHDFGWDWSARASAWIWHVALSRAWPIAMLLFGLYFPQRSRIDLRLPWLKWVLMALVAGTGGLLGTAEFIWTYDIAAAEFLRPMLGRAEQAYVIASMLAISAFFASLGSASRNASHRDAQRRLSFLWTGACISLTPLFLLALYSILSGDDMFMGVPQPITTIALVLLPIFPLTLAYVIVVQRAMNLRVALRVGLQYTLARGGVRIFQVGVISVVISMILTGVHEHMRMVDQLRIIGVGVAALLLQRRLTTKVSDWIDRKFFREAYSADRILIELSEQARTFTETRPLLETVTERVAQTLHIPRAAVLLRDGDNYCLAKTVDGFDPDVRCLPLRARTYAQRTQTRARLFRRQEFMGEPDRTGRKTATAGAGGAGVGSALRSLRPGRRNGAGSQAV
jgi:sigma-B regulation protein RsbU (phosphoserine phosphatase)